MRKESIKHEHMRVLLDEIQSLGEDTPDEAFMKLIVELKHSCLIVAGDVDAEMINVMTVKTDKGDFGMLFTDMDEYRRVFPNFEVEAHENHFGAYLQMLRKSNLLGFILNMEGECMLIPREVLNLIEDAPSDSFSTEDSYTSAELKDLKDSIDNGPLEVFIRNPDNIGRYEELFDEISSSTMLTLMLSGDDLESKAVDGVIPTMESEPLGFLYTDKVGGEYATVYTSEEKMSRIETPFNKYSQLVNFYQIAYFVLNDDMDGIIINPGDEDVVITRDVLLEFSAYLEKNCNDSRLNSAILYMFPIDGKLFCEFREEMFDEEPYFYGEEECWCDEYVPEYDPFDSLDGTHYDFYDS